MYLNERNFLEFQNLNAIEQKFKSSTNKKRRNKNNNRRNKDEKWLSPLNFNVKCESRSSIVRNNKEGAPLTFINS